MTPKIPNFWDCSGKLDTVRGNNSWAPELPQKISGQTDNSLTHFCPPVTGPKWSKIISTIFFLKKSVLTLTISFFKFYEEIKTFK